MKDALIIMQKRCFQNQQNNEISDTQNKYIQDISLHEKIRRRKNNNVN